LLYRGVEASPLPVKYEVAEVAVRDASHCPVPSGSVHAPAHAVENTQSEIPRSAQNDSIEITSV